MNINKLEFFPLSFFSVIMGLAGYSIVLQKAAHLFSLSSTFSNIFLYAVISLFFLLLALYILKYWKFPAAVRAELNHPIKLSFAPTFSISILLLSIAFYDLAPEFSKYLWIAGSILYLFATITILSIWVRQSKFEITHFNPSWFIPIVGNILVPIVGVNHASAEISWFFYSIGIVFWLLFFTIFMNRIIFHNPLPEKLLPTFFILIAPPALGFISYLKLTESLNSFAKILYFFALFLLIFLLAQFKMFAKIKFYLSCWAYSFPIAALTIATFLIYSKTNLLLYKFIFLALVALLSLFIVFLLIYTFRAILNNEICAKED